jgi:hypothetical protein
MNEHTHRIVGSIVSGGFFYLAHHLKDACDWASFIASILSAIAAALTIASFVHSWLKKRRNKKNDRTTHFRR